VRVTAIVLLLFVLSDLGNTAAEFGRHRFRIAHFAQYLPFLNKFVLVPLAARLRFHDGDARKLPHCRKGLFAFCVVYLAYVASGFLVHPPWHEILLQTILPHFVPDPAYILTAIGVIGTTISPWMQFYIQSSVVEKGIRIKEYPYSRIDVITGAVITDVIAFFIVVACGATIYAHNAHLARAGDP